MLCRKPFTKDGAAYPCGQCMPCRVRRKREWTNRILLESMCHQTSCFATLTYNDQSLPYTSSTLDTGVYPTLDRQHLTLWLKRFRRAIEPAVMRFYGVGEYGDDILTPVFVPGRPHYHVIMFGVKGCDRGLTRSLDYGTCCPVCDLFSRTWGMGHVFIGQLTLESAGYVAGYTVKKMTSADDKRLRGRAPEFMQPSTRPGIGVPAMWNVARSMIETGLDQTMSDVPAGVRIGSGIMPYGRTLRRKLRTMLGRYEGAPPSTVNEYKAEIAFLRSLWESSESSLSFSKWLSSVDDARVLDMDARSRIFHSRRKL